MLIHVLWLALWCFLLLPAQTDEQIGKSQKARELMSGGQFGEAVPLYRELVQAIPGNPGLLLNLAMAQHMSGDDRSAIVNFQSALKLQPDMFPALAMLGAAHMRLGQVREAIPPLNKAVRAQPRTADVRRMLAEALLSTGEHTQAAEHFRELTALEPRNPDAFYGLGRGWESLALQSFEQLGKRATGSAWWLALIAESRMQAEQKSSAFYFFRQAAQKNPSLRGVHAGLAAVYRATGHNDWAVAEEQKETSLPRPDCRTAAAECHYMAGRYLEALQATGPARTPEALYWRTKAANALAAQAFAHLEALGDSLPLHRFRADQHRARGRFRDAVAELKKVLALRPNDLLIQRDLATSIYLSRDFAAAEPLLRQLLDQQPEAADLRFLLGDSLLQMQQTDKAIPLLEGAVQRDPKLLPAHSALGRALLQAGKPERAVPHLRSALPMDEDGSLHYQLMRAYQQAGNTELAAQTMRKYQEMQKAYAAAKAELDKEAEITAPAPR